MSFFSKLFGSKPQCPLIGKSFFSGKQMVITGDDFHNPKEQKDEVHLEFKETSVLITYVNIAKKKLLNWEFEKKEHEGYYYFDDEGCQWILSPTHVTHSQWRNEITTIFILGDPENRSKITIEESAMKGRIMLLQMSGMNVSDQIESYHFCSNCKKTSIGLAAIDNKYGNNLPKLALKFKECPNEIIGEEKNCPYCGKSKTILVKLIFQRTSPRNNFDVHYYFQYETPFSEYAVEIISVTLEGKMMRFSQKERERFLGFLNLRYKRLHLAC